MKRHNKLKEETCNGPFDVGVMLGVFGVDWWWENEKQITPEKKNENKKLWEKITDKMPTGTRWE